MSYMENQLSNLIDSGLAQQDTEQDIKMRISKGLISVDLEPIMCECGSTDFLDKVTDRIDNLTTEIDRSCSKCKKLLGCWSYGYWLP